MGEAAPTTCRVGAAVAAALALAGSAGCAGVRAPDPGADARPATAGPRGSAAAPRPVPTPAPGAARPRAPALLVGIWRPVSAGAGRDVAPAGDLALEFRSDGTWSIVGASYRARGAYRWVEADEIELTTVDSNLPTQVGTRSRRRVAVDASELALTAATPDVGGRRAADAAGITTAYRRAGGR